MWQLSGVHSENKVDGFGASLRNASKAALPCVVHTCKWIPEFSILHDEVRLRQRLQAAAAA